MEPATHRHSRWWQRLAAPLAAQQTARQWAARYPDLDAAAIVELMRAQLGPDPGESDRQHLVAVARHLPAYAPSRDRAAGAARAAWYSPSALVLIAANLLPLYGVLVHHWPVFPVMLLFWLENVVIGALNVLRILLASPADGARWAAKLALVPFFCVHYGLFTAVHGLFVFSLFGGEPYQALVHGLWTIDAARRAVEGFALWPALGALAASHLFSFFWNYLGRREFQQARPEVLMHAPYNRVLVLHVSIILGGMLIQLFHSPVWALLLLIGLKIGVDLRAHLKEHRRQQPAESPAASP